MTFIRRYPSLVQGYTATVPASQNFVDVYVAQPHIAAIGSIITNYNSIPAVRNTRFPYPGMLPVENVFYQFYWTPNSQTLWTWRQKNFAEQILLPYNLGAAVRMFNAQFAGLNEYAPTLGVRAYAPHGTQFQVSNQGIYWQET